jgi:hypothetical protein
MRVRTKVRVGVMVAFRVTTRVRSIRSALLFEKHVHCITKNDDCYH